MARASASLIGPKLILAVILLAIIGIVMVQQFFVPHKEIKPSSATGFSIDEQLDQLNKTPVSQQSEPVPEPTLDRNNP